MASRKKVNSRVKIHDGAISMQGASRDGNTGKAMEYACVWPRKDLDSPQPDFHMGLENKLRSLYLYNKHILNIVLF